MSTDPDLIEGNSAEAPATRIEPQLDANGQPTELTPAHGGRWLRHADGSLEPADAQTAAAAGLAWAG